MKCYHSRYCGPGSNGNEGEHNIPQSSRAGASPFNGLMSYLGSSLGKEYYPSVEMKSGYSAATDIMYYSCFIMITLYTKIILLSYVFVQRHSNLLKRLINSVTQPFHTSWMQHKSIFKQLLTGLNSEFYFP